MPIPNAFRPYEHMRALLKDADPFILAAKAGVPYDRHQALFSVTLMGRLFTVNYPSGEVTGFGSSSEDGFVVKTLLLRYLLNASGEYPTGTVINYRDVSGGAIYYPNFQGRCLHRLARLAGGRLDVFARVMERLGGVRGDAGDLSYRFAFLNNIYLTFILWRGDDEFPPDANILFDANVSSYFTAEDLAAVGEVALGFLKEMMQDLDNEQG